MELLDELLYIPFHARLNIEKCFLFCFNRSLNLNSDVRLFAITVSGLWSLSLLLRLLLVGWRRTVRRWDDGGGGRRRWGGAIEESSELRDTPTDLSPPRCLTSGTLHFGCRRRRHFDRLVLVAFNIFRFRGERWSFKWWQRMRPMLSSRRRIFCSCTTAFSFNSHFAPLGRTPYIILLVTTDNGRPFRRCR